MWPVADEPPFIVRAHPLDASQPPEDQEAATFPQAVRMAMALACDKRLRSVLVTDYRSTLWAQFNCLWSIMEP